MQRLYATGRSVWSRYTGPVIHAPVAVLDLGKVLFQYDIWRAVDAIRRAGETRFDPDENPFLGEMLIRFEKGQISTSDYLAWLRARHHLDIGDEALERAMLRMFLHEVAGMAEIVKALSMTHTLVLFSNTNISHFEFLKTRMTMLRHFHHIVLSYEIGARKPEAAAYEHIERVVCHDGRPDIYADDLGENVAAAHARGWPAYQFTTSERFRDYLIGRGIVAQEWTSFQIEKRGDAPPDAA